MKAIWNKMKVWQKVLAIAILVGAVGSLFTPAKNKQPNAPAITQAQVDSIAIAKRLEEGKNSAIVNLRIHITKGLNDPKSFDVLEQKAWVVGDNSIVVMIEYTGKNMIGGTVRQTIKAEASADGTLTKVYE